MWFTSLALLIMSRGKAWTDLLQVEAWNPNMWVGFKVNGFYSLLVIKAACGKAGAAGRVPGCPADVCSLVGKQQPGHR